MRPRWWCALVGHRWHFRLDATAFSHDRYCSCGAVIEPHDYRKWPG